MGVEVPHSGVVPEPQTKPKAPAKSKENDIGSFIQQLIGLASYVHQLQVQSHLMHFNYEAGQTFWVYINFLVSNMKRTRNSSIRLVSSSDQWTTILPDVP
jgi:hypothetical protein